VPEEPEEDVRDWPQTVAAQEAKVASLEHEVDTLRRSLQALRTETASLQQHPFERSPVVERRGVTTEDAVAPFFLLGVALGTILMVILR